MSCRIRYFVQCTFTIINYQKAFDRVQHQKVMDILKNIALAGKDLRIIATPVSYTHLDVYKRQKYNSMLI